jgi:heptaprenyl diphosphate synthase
MLVTYPIPKKIVDDLKLVEESLAQAIIASGDLTEVSQLILKAGGKRLRPALVLISGLVGEYNLKRLIPAAVAVELVHMASLIHDDVIDQAYTRRGQPTANLLWGDHIAIAAGDFLFATAFKYLANLQDVTALKILVRAAVDLSYGELEQMQTARVLNLSLSKYLEKIRRKTASLFSACCELGGWLSKGDRREVLALASFGQNLGMAFQIFDDILDITGGLGLGKARGIDIRDGTLTLPIIFALDEVGLKSNLARIFRKQDQTGEEIELALSEISSTNALSRSKDEANRYIESALQSLSQIKEVRVREILEGIANFVVNRSF